MASKDPAVPCIVCNPREAEEGEYCDAHREELHRLDHQYETFFRLQRTSRGKDHETYSLFFQGDCDPCGRILVTETDPENLSITIVISGDLDLESRITEYASLKITRTYGDQLRDRVEREIIHSWYGNARACVDVFRATTDRPQHWDIPSRDEQAEEDGTEPHPPDGGKHSVH